MRLDDLIGFSTIARPHESPYAFVSRLIRNNLLTDIEVRQLLPVEWCVHAFSPFDTPIEKITESLTHWIDDDSVIRQKVDIRACQLFPELISHAPDSLRICPTCIETGRHSFAYQDDLIERCPVHSAELSCKCPHCYCELVWGDRSHPSQWAMRCPRGCELCSSPFLGLFEPEPGYQAALKYHLDWLESARSTFRFSANPTHITYPPRLASNDLHSSRPSPGLTATLCDLLRANGAAIARCPEYYSTYHGQWDLKANAWSDEAAIKCARKIEPGNLIQLISRGSYTTQIPIFDTSRLKIFFEKKETQGYAERHDFSKRSGIDVLNIPSHLITNSEVAALRRIMMSDLSDGLVNAYFMDVLIDLLDHSLIRRDALNFIDTFSPLLSISDRFDALILINGDLFRVQGISKSPPQSQTAWNAYCETAELNGGRIYIGSGTGPPH